MYNAVSIKNVIVVKNSTGTAKNHGFTSNSGGCKVENSYTIDATYSVNTSTDNVTTAATLLGNTTWLTAENGWNTDVWTFDASGNLCFGGDIVVSK